MTETVYNPTTRRFRDALRAFKHSATELAAAWETGDIPADVFGDSYPARLGDFSEFARVVADMVPHQKITLHNMPAVGTIVRAKHDLDSGGHFIWPKGWTGTVKYMDGDHVEIEAHRYLGAGANEWDNCRVISYDDGFATFEQENGFPPNEPDIARENVLAAGLFREFEIC